MEKKFEDVTYAEQNTPRYRRARQFSNDILGLICGYLPQDQDFMRKIEYELTQTAYEANIQIILVRPEWDEMTAAQMAVAMLQTHPAVVKIPIDTAS
jgi:hypothetical protein